MWIKEIILEGFKSYATRTVISGFDPQFNAITGLNGSGKSNVLDSILFVLGLNKEWELLRVKKMQELVYKFGHAGITKAEVTIIFDNSDKANSPIGFESFDTLTVTRQISQEKSKYFINGSKENMNKIKNMFRSVQLNIDNPHFLVAQGRITKIINLKPQELISMLEETAGTALYNEKKKESQKIIGKKQEKVNEINELLKKDIEPQMDKLRAEKDQYFLWKSGEAEIQRINKMLRAFDYTQKNHLLDERRVELNSIKNLEEDKQLEKKKIKTQLEKIEADYKNYMDQKGRDSDENYKKIESQYTSLSKQITENENIVKNLKKRLEEYKTEATNFQQTINKDQDEISRLDKKLEFNKKNITQLEGTLKEKKELVEDCARQQKGHSSVEDAKQQVESQIQEAKSNLKANTTEINLIQNKIKHYKNEIALQKDHVEQASRDKEAGVKQSEILQKEMQNIENELQDTNFNENELSNQMEKMKDLENNLMDLNHELNKFLQNGNNWIFKNQFKDPEPNFDKRKVKGRVFTLFKAKDKQFLRALENGAGGKISNIVVDNENTAKLILKKQCFGNQNVNLIPNNKIQWREIHRDTLQSAKRIAQQNGGWAEAAYDLVDYDPDVRNSIIHVFGSFIICSSGEIAKKICFQQDQRCRFRCVTLDGDSHDPRGTLTGGYQSSASILLARYEEYRNLLNHGDKFNHEKRGLDDQISRLKQDKSYYDGLRQEYENKKYKFDLLSDKLRNQSGGNVQRKAENMEVQISDFQEQLEKLNESGQKFEKEIKELNSEKDSYGKNKDIKSIMADKKKKLDAEIKKIITEMSQLKKQINRQEVDRENYEKEIATADTRNIKHEKNINDTVAKIKDSEIQLKNDHQQYKFIVLEKEKLEKQMKLVDKKLSELEENKNKLRIDWDGVEKDICKFVNQGKRFSNEIKEISDKLRELEETYEFIKNDSELFGQAGTEYDFSQFDYEHYSSKFSQLKHDQEFLQKKVNFKVEAMSDKVEKDFKTLISKKEILEKDRTLLVANIDELDKKKTETLEKCYLQVNKSFGCIFSDLLHGAFAKIAPLEGKEVSDGLELSVAFNNVWKKSLSELSGGQRSLLALSFTLALLLYKPAPFYILDEVDSALDLSHTENIGYMIAQRFPQSQFMLISLKDGMYQNANVLFKTSFVDGISKIDRFVLKNKNKKSKKMEIEEGQDKENKVRNRKI